MDVKLWVFYTFASLALMAALNVVISRNPVRAVLSLVLVFFCTSALWMLLEAEFLAVTLVLVYVGAVMVLFLFVVMMLDIDLAPLRSGFIRYLPIGILLMAFVVSSLMMAIGPSQFGLDKVVLPVPKPADYSNVKTLGITLFQDYILAFEVAGCLLLVAIVAAISLTLRGVKRRKHQNPADQVKVNARDRVRLVDLPCEENHS